MKIRSITLVGANGAEYCLCIEDNWTQLLGPNIVHIVEWRTPKQRMKVATYLSKIIDGKIGQNDTIMEIYRYLKDLI